MEEGYLLFDADCRVVCANDAALKMLAMDNSEVVGRTVHEVVHSWHRYSFASECDFERNLRLLTVVDPRFEIFSTKDGLMYPVIYGIEQSHGDSLPDGYILRFSKTKDRRRVGQDLRLLSAITLTIAEVDSWDLALMQVLRLMCTALEWDLGIAWGPQGNSLYLISSWYRESLAELTPSEEEGFWEKLGESKNSLASQAIRERRVLIEHNVQHRSSSGVGFGAEIAIPVYYKDEPIVVLHFFSLKPEMTVQSIDLACLTASYLGALLSRKRFEEALRQSEKRYRMIFESALDGIITLSADTRILSCNPAVETIFGYKSEEITGKRLEMLVPGFTEEWLPLSNDEEPAAYDMTLMGSSGDGADLHLELSLSRVNGLDESPVFVCILRDVTRRTKIEKLVRVQSSLLRRQAQMLDMAPVAVVATEFDTGIVIYWNHGAEKMYGWTKGEAKGKLLSSLINTDKSVDANIYSSLKSVGFWDGELHVNTRDGQMLTILSHKALQRDEEGLPASVLHVDTDITDRKRMEEQQERLLLIEQEQTRRLRELAQMKADFSAMIAHELNSPIAAIRAVLDVIEQANANMRHKDLLNVIKREVDVLASLAGDVYNASEYEKSDFEVSLSPVRLKEIVMDAYVYGQSLLSEYHPIEVVGDTDVLVLADRERIGQVMRNLLSNAAKYSQRNSPILIRTDMLEDKAKLEVVDQGPGIHPDDMDKIFRKFGRGRDLTGRKLPGLGLGLYVSRRIIQLHGSDLEVSSQLGKGSIFSFYLERVVT